MEGQWRDSGATVGATVGSDGSDSGSDMGATKFLRTRPGATVERQWRDSGGTVEGQCMYQRPTHLEKLGSKSKFGLNT